MNKIFRKILIDIIKICIFLTICNLLYSEDNFKNKMDKHISQVQNKWRFNPFRYETLKRLYGWLDPEVYNSKYWIGDIFNIENMYPKYEYRFDKMAFYHQPTLATEINPIDILYKDNHRFRIGVGFLTQFYLSVYKPNFSIYYGESLFFGTYMQTELYFDYIYKESLRFRFTPVRHVCAHIGGDILGDYELYDINKEEFRDSSIESMNFAIYYNYGYFTFYGGFSFAMSGFNESNFINLFKISYGTDFRLPIWGEISLITGIYAALDYDKINFVYRAHNFKGYRITDSYNKCYPFVAVGIGIEVYRFTLGIKYEYNRSRQLYAYRKMESKLGLEATLFF